MGDGYFLGTPGSVFSALADFERSLRSECGLSVQRAKTVVLADVAAAAGRGGLDFSARPEGMPMAGLQVEGAFEPGLLVYGVPVGSAGYVKAALAAKVGEVVAKARKVEARIEPRSKQALWQLLRLCVNQQLDY